ENSWSNLEILSVHNELESPKFGRPTFTPIIGFTRSIDSHILKFTLDDGRVFQCTPNHMIPKLIRNPTRSKKQEAVEAEYDVIEVSAEDIELGDDVLILGTNYFSNTPPQHLFIPDCIDSGHLTVGMKRKDFKRFAYRKGQSVESDLIQTIINEFRYSKVSKMYKARWTALSESAKEMIRRDADNVAPLYVKMTESTEQYREAGKWQRITIQLDDDFFSLMGWYLSEGHVGVNRISFSQYVVANPQNHQAICTTLTDLGWSYATYSEKDIVVHSNVLAAVFESLCSIGSKNKRIPIELLDHQRATVLLDSYFKGDGNFNIRSGRRYTTASKQLANDLVFLLGALGRYVSIHRDEGIFRIVETKGYQYRRKHHGLVGFGSSLAVRVKSIEKSESVQPVFDMETGNGWFVTTNGVIVHNSYGVTGAQHFELFCMPAAESVTAYGRDAILRTKEKAESMGVRVLYGDTDSVFLDSPTIEQQEELVLWSSEDLKIDLEVEKTYKYVALSDRKKNYIGVYTSGYVEVKGLSGKKRNTPEFAQTAFKDMLDVLSRVDNPEGFESAKDEIREIINCVLDRLEGKAESYTPEDLAFRVQMTKALDQYGDTKPMHVRAAQMLKDAGYDVPPGTIVEYIKIKGRDDILPVQMAKESDFWLDKDRYIDTLRSVFDQVLDSVGLNFDEMLGFTTLDQFF
ncbi:MAG: DNA polymerase domain-containing protein, partial [Candidatus Thorarchaeota archaeon]